MCACRIKDIMEGDFFFFQHVGGGLIVPAVKMAMDLAIGLKKKMVRFNNIFNKYEFELYGRGEILEPDFECSCYYSPTCPNNCMQYLSVAAVFESCQRLLGHAPAATRVPR